MIMLLIVCASIFGSLLFAYLFLWTTSPGIWPDAQQLPPLMLPLVDACLLIGSSASVIWAGCQLRKAKQAGLRLGLPIALLLLITAIGLEVYGQWQTGLRPQDSAYAASVYAMLGLQGVFAMVTCYMALFTVARSAAGRLSQAQRVCYDNTMLFWHYAVAQGLFALGIIHGFPRLTG